MAFPGNQAVMYMFRVLVLCLLATTVQAKPGSTLTDLDADWQHYKKVDSAKHPKASFPFATCFKRSATVYDIPLTLLLAVARGESNFDARAVSRANALGVMQILWPDTARHLGIRQKAELFKPCVNIDAGARYLKELLGRYNGNIHRALAAYNYGPGRVPLPPVSMPGGARWYSGYIFQHLDSIINRPSIAAGTRPETITAKGGRKQLIVFSSMYRAKAFIAKIEKTQPALRLALGRTRARTYGVDMLYQNSGELASGLKLLEQAGYTLN